MDGKKLTLDKVNKMTVKLSNDAYYYFFEGEEPLDDNSWDEIAEISATFENGFEQDESVPTNVDTKTGQYEVTIIPYIELVEEQRPKQLETIQFDESLWDGCFNAGGLFPWLFYFKFISSNHVKIAQINKHFNERLDDCEGDVTWIDSKPWIKYKTKPSHKGYSLMPIWSKRCEIFDNESIQEFLLEQ